MLIIKVPAEERRVRYQQKGSIEPSYIGIECLLHDSQGSAGNTHHPRQPGELDVEVSRYIDSSVGLCTATVMREL
ncbi:hypothetical protein KM043_013909 [Ampulex compressa]|nr:hypothetical protein KM043_013909 [Ampulex compressa]